MEEKELKKKSSLGVAAFVLGIISILTALFWYMAIPAGVLAIIFGVKAIKKVGSKLGKSGLITGIIGLSLVTFLYISMIIIIVLSNI